MANTNKFVEKVKNVDRLIDIIIKRINEHMERFTNFTIGFCWKLKNDEHSITIVKKDVPGSGLNQESLQHIIKRVFNQTNIDNFEKFGVVFVST